MKLLIVDDEPLVSVGIESMLNWKEYDIQLLPHAFNGEQALKMIEEYRPDIVITDIKMPLMSGLELIRECRSRNYELPIFLLLTVYEDFEYAKEAISYNVLDYLIKLDLTPDILKAAVERAVKSVDKIKNENNISQFSLKEQMLSSIQNKFFIYLLHNLFESTEQFQLQSENLGLQFDFGLFSVAYCYTGNRYNGAAPHAEASVTMSVSILQIAKELLRKHIPCYTVSMDLEYFCIIFCWKTKDIQEFLLTIREAMENMCEMIYSYFHADVKCTLGETVNSASSISASYQTARLLMSSSDSREHIVFYNPDSPKLLIQNTFNISIFRKEFSLAFEEFNIVKINSLFHDIIVLFQNKPQKLLQATDISCNILHLCISLLPSGEEIVMDIFSDEPENYLTIHSLTSVMQVINYLNKLNKGLCQYIEREQKHLTNHIVANIRKYICSHVCERITQREVAAIFGITSNYLSILFRKYNDTCFNDYVNQVKIEKAKELLRTENLKVYEVAEILNFSSEFYFSKVFKNIAGCSPSSYLQKHSSSP